MRGYFVGNYADTFSLLMVYTRFTAEMPAKLENFYLNLTQPHHWVKELLHSFVQTDGLNGYRKNKIHLFLFPSTL